MLSTTPSPPSSLNSHLDTIKHYLHKGTAAVMVGAGFSRNADPTMPLWGDLAIKLAQLLGRSENITPEDVLDLAQAYEDCRLTRAAITDFIKENIKDTADASSLHVALLSLPWSDIFTTNYDRFLEKASANFDRFKLVASKGDFSLSRERGKCRIIKLHGTLPSLEHCVFTKNDYERYPEDYDIFVTAVKNSMSENVFVLLGFSGTDPNFVNWVRWVRQELGAHSPPVFMIHLTPLSQKEQDFLKQYKVTPIDISQLTTPKAIGNSFDAEKLDYSLPPSSPSIYEPAFLAFFDYLRIGCDESSLSGKHDTKKSFDLWKYPDLYIVRQREHELTQDEVHDVTKLMRDARERYPGWIVPPYETLTHLWGQHMNVRFLVKRCEEIWAAQSLPVMDLLNILYECCWLLDIAHLPVFDDLDEAFVQVLEKTFTELKDGTHGLSRDMASLKANMWTSIALLCLRWARGERTNDFFAALEAKLVKMFRSYPSPHGEAALRYQKILWCLEGFDRSGALELAKSWKFAPNCPPVWLMRKAMLLGELGEVLTGYKLLTQLYNELLPTAQSPDCPLPILSTARMALDGLRLYSLLPKNGPHLWDKKSERSYRNIPVDVDDALPSITMAEPDMPAILEKLQGEVKIALGDNSHARSKVLFEIGHRDNSRHLYYGLRPGLREAFQSIGVLEALSRPATLGFMSINTEPCLHISQLLFYLRGQICAQSVRLLLRAAPDKTFKSGQDIFLRHNLARMPEEHAGELATQLLHGLDALLDKKRYYPIDKHYVSFGLELLGRLCVRVRSTKVRQTLLEHVSAWMMRGPDWQQLNALDDMLTFCSRVVETSSLKLLRRYAARLMNTPVLIGFEDFHIAVRALSFVRKADLVAGLPPEVPGLKPSPLWFKIGAELWSGLEKLRVESNVEDKWSGHIFTRYAWRLLWMHKNGLLDQNTREAMATGIWSGYKEQGLPRLLGMWPFVILDWPAPPEISVTARYKAELLQKKIPPSYVLDDDKKLRGGMYANQIGSQKSYPSYYIAPLQEYLRVGIDRKAALCLSREDLLSILEECRQVELEDISSSPEWVKEYAVRPLNSVTWILVYVFGAKLLELSEYAPWISSWLLDLIKYGNTLGEPCLLLRTLNLLFADSEQYSENLALDLQEFLYGDDENRCLEAGYAVLVWRSELENHSSIEVTSSRRCPLDLRRASLSGFWLLEKIKASTFAAVLTEQFSSYPTLQVDDWEEHRLLRGLEQKRLMLAYGWSAKPRNRQELAHWNDWLANRNDLELLPESRLAVGRLVVKICGALPHLNGHPIIQAWIKEMQSDALAEMRRLGDEIG